MLPFFDCFATLHLQVELLWMTVEDWRLAYRLPRDLRLLPQTEESLWGDPAWSPTFDVDQSVVDGYDARFKACAQRLLEYKPTLSFAARVPVMCALRIVCCALVWGVFGAAWTTTPTTTMALYVAGHLLFAPLCVVPSFSNVVTSFEVVCGHYMGVTALTWAWRAAVPEPVQSLPTVTVSAPFAALFIAADIAAGVAVYLQGQPGNPSRRLSLRTWAVDFAFSLVHGRTYLVLLFGLLQGSTVNIAVLVLDGLLGVTPRIGAWLQSALGMSLEPLFYLQHRVSHLPRVYEHGHKFHHIHSSFVTPFDTSNFMGGVGLPEELGALVVDAGLSSLLGVQSWLFNWTAMQTIYYFKATHTHVECDAKAANQHVLHHLKHTVVFGGDPMDLLFHTHAVKNDVESSCGRRIHRSETTSDSGKPVVRLTIS